MNDISLYQYSILPRLFVQRHWNIGQMKCCYVWRTSKYIYCVLYHHDINDVVSEKSKRLMWTFFQNFDAKDRILISIQSAAAYNESVISTQRKEMGWVISNGMQRVIVNLMIQSYLLSSEQMTFEVQYNPQCLVLQGLFKYAMCQAEKTSKKHAL